MKPLILHPTETSQWHALVNEAQAATCLVINEELESYLVFLLMRYSHNAQLMESILSLDFLHALQKNRTAQFQSLRNVGDKSLLFCGLFPHMAQKRNVSLNYFKDLGRLAYLTLGELQDDKNSALYFNLSAQFNQLKDILQAMRGEFCALKSTNNGIIAQKDLPLH